MKKKLIIYILITFFCMLPISTYAYTEIGAYAPYDGNQQVSGCSASGYYNFGMANIGWTKVALATNVQYAQNQLFIAHKYDLAAQSYFDVKYYFKSGTVKKALTSSRIKIYSGDNCGSMTLSNDINLISVKTNATSSSNGSYVIIRIYTNSLIANWGIYIDGRNSNGTFTDMTSSNWYLSKVGINTVDMTGNNQIIENNNNNTNNIINNQNENTQDIINNNNQNTQQLIDSQQNCYNIDKSSIIVNKYLGSTGILYDSNSYGATDFINITNAKIKLITPDPNNYSIYTCFYREDKTPIACFKNNELVTDIVPPNNSYYLRTSINKSADYPILQVCKNSSNSLNDSITSDAIPSGNDYFDDFNDMLPTNNTISNLITLPISLYTKVLNSINGTCSAISLGSLYNTELIMPCINLEQYLGSTLWNTIDLIISGCFVLVIAKKMVKAFHNFTSMKDGDVLGD